MERYGKGFAQVYNLLWAGFARRVAPAILDHYARSALGEVNTAMLDLCCGTGQFAVEALQRGFRVVGIDASPHMLALARANAAAYVKAGQAEFHQGDARGFRLKRRMGLAVSTYDSINHLESEADLLACFRCVSDAVDEGGIFIFDLNTRARLRQWTGIEVSDTEDLALIQRSFFLEDQNRAYARITGFARDRDGRYTRFDETLANTAFHLETVAALLRQAGWRTVRFAAVDNLSADLPDPERADRVCIVAGK